MWERNPQEAIYQGLCDEKGNPLDNRMFIKGNPNPYYLNRIRHRIFNPSKRNSRTEVEFKC